MYLYNSLSHKKELFTPKDPANVKMYTCGPTVYHFAHIGNLRSYIGRLHPPRSRTHFPCSAAGTLSAGDAPSLPIGYTVLFPFNTLF